MSVAAAAGQCPVGGFNCLDKTNPIAPPTKTDDPDQCGKSRPLLIMIDLSVQSLLTHSLSGIRCQLDPSKRCNFWSMIPIGTGSESDAMSDPLSDCWLLSNCNEPKPEVGVISGTKDCPPQE